MSGSNPNPDYTVGADVEYPTEYRTELFYPSYFDERRPQPNGILSSYTYGGPPFNISLDAQDLFGDVNNIKTAKVVVIRFGFSTHSMVRFCCRFCRRTCYAYVVCNEEYGPTLCRTADVLYRIPAEQHRYATCSPTAAQSCYYRPRTRLHICCCEWRPVNRAASHAWLRQH